MSSEREDIKKESGKDVTQTRCLLTKKLTKIRNVESFRNKFAEYLQISSRSASRETSVEGGGDEGEELFGINRYVILYLIDSRWILEWKYLGFIWKTSGDSFFLFGYC